MQVLLLAPVILVFNIGDVILCFPSLRSAAVIFSHLFYNCHPTVKELLF